MFAPSFSYENQLWDQHLTHIAGIDEVGRGCLAGPVVTAAVIFPPHFNPELLTGVTDSKLLNHAKRLYLTDIIKKTALAYSITLSSVSTINRFGIIPAAFQAMRQAIKKLPHCDHVLVDAFYIPHLKNLSGSKQTPIIKGDQKSLSIAAASILAKVYRDQLMTNLHPHYSQYGWLSNKGYGTKTHQQALAKYGPTPHHRTLFIRKFTALSDV